MWPRADAVLFAPTTFNSVNAWALGLTGTFVVGVVAEGIGTGVPLVAVPCVNAAYAQHPAFDSSVEILRDAGVTVLYGEGGFVPNQPGQGRPQEYLWGLALDAVEEAWSRREGAVG